MDLSPSRYRNILVGAFQLAGLVMGNSSSTRKKRKILKEGSDSSINNSCGRLISSASSAYEIILSDHDTSIGDDCVGTMSDISSSSSHTPRNIIDSFFSPISANGDENEDLVPWSLYDVVTSHRWSVESHDHIAMCASFILSTLKMYGASVPHDGRLINEGSQLMYRSLNNLCDELSKMKANGWNLHQTVADQKSCWSCEVRDAAYKHVTPQAHPCLEDRLCVVCLQVVPEEMFSEHCATTSHRKEKLRLIKDAYPHSCPGCDMRFCRAADLRSHLSVHNASSDNNCSVSDREFKPLFCFLCRLHFLNTTDMGKHNTCSLEHARRKEMAIEFSTRMQEISRDPCESRPKKDVLSTNGTPDKCGERLVTSVAEAENGASEYYCGVCSVYVQKTAVILHEESSEHRHCRDSLAVVSPKALPANGGVERTQSRLSCEQTVADSKRDLKVTDEVRRGECSGAAGMVSKEVELHTDGSPMRHDVATPTRSSGVDNLGIRKQTTDAAVFLNDFVEQKLCNAFLSMKISNLTELNEPCAERILSKSLPSDQCIGGVSDGYSQCVAKDAHETSQEEGDSKQEVVVIEENVKEELASVGNDDEELSESDEFECEHCGVVFPIFNGDVELSMDMHIQNDPIHSLASAVPIERDAQSLAEMTQKAAAVKAPAVKAPSVKAPKSKSKSSSGEALTFEQKKHLVMSEVLSLEQEFLVSEQRSWYCELCSASFKTECQMFHHIVSPYHLSDKWFKRVTYEEQQRRSRVMFQLLKYRYAVFAMREAVQWINFNKPASTSKRASQSREAPSSSQLEKPVNSMVFLPSKAPEATNSSSAASSTSSTECAVKKARRIFFCEVCNRGMHENNKESHLSGTQHTSKMKEVFKLIGSTLQPQNTA